MSSFLQLSSEAKLEEILTQASRCCDGSPCRVSVIGVTQQGEFLKKQFLNHESLEEYFRSEKEAPSTMPLRLFLLDGQVPTGDDSNKCHVHFHSEAMKLLCCHEGMTPRFLTDVYECDDWTVFPTTSSLPKGVTPKSALQYGFWVWEEASTHSFIQLLQDHESANYFCLNFSKQLQDHISKAIESRPKSLADVRLFVDMAIVEHILKFYRAAIAQKRDVLKQNERGNKTMSKDDYEARARQLHQLAVDWHTIRKDLLDIGRHIEHLLSVTNPDAGGKHRFPHFASHSAHESLSHLGDFCLFWRRWVDTYIERTTIGINLMHHLSSQRIAEQVQRDSVSMFTLATVTAIFLPGTFVCSILSTVFFDYNENGVSVSPSWWILPAIAVPLTVLVLIVWFSWYRNRLNYSVSEPLKSKGLGGIDSRVWSLAGSFDESDSEKVA